MNPILAGCRQFYSLAVLGTLCLTSACSSNDPDVPDQLSQAELEDPATCAKCHSTQTAQWAGSMHAYAAEDPIFLALNAKGQRETGGKLGPFCLQCHAPIAFQKGLSRDGLNLASLPASVKGVTCYACHSVASVTRNHNNGVTRSPVLRGSYANVAAAPHPTAYSTLHDRNQSDSASMCGTCHDSVALQGAHAARTYKEWTNSLYAQPDPRTLLTCGNCHMAASVGKIANNANLPNRLLHDHTMAAVDVAITPFPDSLNQAKLVQEALDRALIAKLCVKPYLGGVQAEVSLDNAFAGHAFPSGAAYHRRAWLEITGSRAGKVVWSSGVVAGASSVASVATGDPQMLWLHDALMGPTGNPVSTLWEAASTKPTLLDAAVTNNPKDPRYFHALIRTFDVPAPIVDTIDMVVKLRPIDRDVLDDLVAGGDLSPMLRDRIATYELGSTKLRWKFEQGFVCVP